MSKNAKATNPAIDEAVKKAIGVHSTGLLPEYDPLTIAMSFVAEVDPDCTLAEVQDTIERVAGAMERDGNMADILWGIWQRLAVPPRPNETMREVVARAAEAGDEEAIALLRRPA